MLRAGGAAIFPHINIYHKGNTKVKRFFARGDFKDESAEEVRRN
jgi:hypothetical protein